MQQGNHKIFNIKANLYRLVNLRLVGFSYDTLGYLFRCDRKSVEKQCRNYDIDNATDSVFNIQRIINKTLPEPKEDNFIQIGNERICQGRSYEEYFKKEYPHRNLTAIY